VVIPDTPRRVKLFLQNKPDKKQKAETRWSPATFERQKSRPSASPNRLETLYIYEEGYSAFFMPITGK